MHGDADTTVPVDDMRAFRNAMQQANNHCELHEYPGRGHAFFNFGNGDDYHATTRQMLRFLDSWHDIAQTSRA